MYNLLMFLAVLLLQLTTISSDDHTFCETSSDSKFESGEESAAICAVFHGMNETDPKPLFYFSSEVDEYTLIVLSSSDLSSNMWKDEARMQIEVGGKQSSNRTIIKDGYVVTQIGIVIIAKDGKIDDLVWDDGCFACSGSKCVDNKNCGIEKTECSDDTNCDVKIYVSWYGTDKSGSYLLSAGQRLSQFEGATASDYYNSVEDEASSLADF